MTTSQRAAGSTLASLGVSGYLVGLALPLSSTVDLPLIFLIPLAALAALSSPKQRWHARAAAALPVIAFAIARLASALAAPETARSLKMITPVLPALLVFFVLAEWVRTEDHVVVIALSLAVAGLLLATTFVVTGWLSPADNADAWAAAMPSPLLVVKNDLAVVAVLAPVALAAALMHPRPIVRILVAAFFAVLATAIGAMRSRTVLVTTIVAVGSFVGLIRIVARRGTSIAQSRRVWFLAGAAVGGVILLDGLLGFRLASKLLSDWQGNGRLALWAAALAMFQDAPFLGHGPHSFVLQYRARLDALALPAWVAVDPRITPWPHNLFLELLAEQGAVGLAAFLAVAASGIAMAVRLARVAPGRMRYLAAGAGAALIAFLTASIVELTLLRVWVTIVLFTLLGLLATMTRLQHEGQAC